MQNLPPLTILEEFLLLALDDEAGLFWPVPRSAFDCATAAAVLMDLMRLKRVDCDLKHILVTNADPLGDDILDPVLQALALDPVQSSRAILDEFSFLSEEAEALRDRAVRRLVERGILREEERKFLWIFGERRYPVVNDLDVRRVKLCVINAVKNNAIPDPHDVCLVSLAKVCDLFQTLLNPRELTQSYARMVQVAGFDVLGRAAAEAVAEVETSVAMVSGLR